MNIIKKKLLITVTAHPLPSISYDELVCTAGVDENGDWFRIYPVPLKLIMGIRDNNEIKSFKYTWIEIELLKKKGDFRPESYSPAYYDFSKIKILDTIGTSYNWKERKKYCLKNLYTNFTTLISDSKKPNNKSLAAFKPNNIIDFLWETDSRDWKKEWKKLREQNDLFLGISPKINIQKLPYKFYYKFKDDNRNIHRLLIEDWEISALYWNCLRSAKNDEKEALKKVKEKYFFDFALKKDLYFFLGTTLEWHLRGAPNPFVIVGVFYPPKEPQLDLNF